MEEDWSVILLSVPVPVVCYPFLFVAVRSWFLLSVAVAVRSCLSVRGPLFVGGAPALGLLVPAAGRGVPVCSWRWSGAAVPPFLGHRCCWSWVGLPVCPVWLLGGTLLLVHPKLGPTPK